MKNVVIGVDFGTLSGRALAVNAATGEEMASCSMDYPHGIIGDLLPDGTKGQPGEVYEDPADYEAVLSHTVKTVLEKGQIDPEDVIAIGMDFTFCTILPVLKDGTPLSYTDEFKTHPRAYVKLWKNHTAEKEAAAVNALAEETDAPYRYWNGGSVTSEYLIPKIWETLNRDPEVYHSAAFFIEAGDWLTWRLTGVQVRNVGMAGYRGMWKDGYVPKEFLRRLDPELEDLEETKLKAPVLPAGSQAGVIDAYGSELTGLLPGTLVSVCTGDCLTTMIAAGITKPGTMGTVIGTSACQMALTDGLKDVRGSNGCVYNGMVPGYYAVEAGQCCVGDHFAWFVDHMVPGSYEREAAERGISVYALLEEKAAKVNPGESGVMALDWWNGTRSPFMDTELTGLFIGCTLNTKPEELFRALVEATAFGARMIIEKQEKAGVEVDYIIATGGIAHKDPGLMQLYADVLDKEIRVAACLENGALGSAVLALLAAGRERGGYDTAEEACRVMIRPEVAAFIPRKEHRSVYDRLYKEYVGLTEELSKPDSPVKKLLGIRREALDRKKNRKENLS